MEHPRKGLWSGGSGPSLVPNVSEIPGIHILLPGSNSCWTGFSSCKEARDFCEKRYSMRSGLGRIVDRRPVEDRDPALVVVHPGSIYGSARAQLGKSKAAAIKEEILSILASHEDGPLLIIDGTLSDEIPASDEDIITSAIERTARNGYPSARSWGSDDGERPYLGYKRLEKGEIFENQEDAAVTFIQEHAFDGRPVRVAGAWAGIGTGCATSVADAIAAACPGRNVFLSSEGLAWDPDGLERILDLDEETVLSGPNRPTEDVDIDPVFASSWDISIPDFLSDHGRNHAAPWREESWIKSLARSPLVPLPEGIVPSGIRIVRDPEGMGVLAFTKASQVTEPQMVGQYHGSNLIVRDDMRGSGIGSALVAARLFEDGALPCWDHDTPGYSPAGAAAHASGLRRLQGAIPLDLPCEPDLDPEP